METSLGSIDAEWIKKLWCRYIHNGRLFSCSKRGNPAICDNVDEPWGCYAKWSKSDRERWKDDLTFLWNLKKHKDNKKTKLIERDKICSSQRSGLEVMGKRNWRKVTHLGKVTFTKGINFQFIRYWRCKARDDDYSHHCCTMYTKVVKRVILSYHYKEKLFFLFLFIVAIWEDGCKLNLLW